jgi:hypothetical protein
MARHLAFGGAGRPVGRGVSSVACLAFVILMGLVFWAATAWLGEILLRAGALGN